MQKTHMHVSVPAGGGSVYPVEDPSAASPLPRVKQYLSAQVCLFTTPSLFLSLNYRLVETKNCITSLPFRLAPIYSVIVV